MLWLANHLELSIFCGYTTDKGMPERGFCYGATCGPQQIVQYWNLDMSNFHLRPYYNGNSATLVGFKGFWRVKMVITQILGVNVWRSHEHATYYTTPSDASTRQGIVHRIRASSSSVKLAECPGPPSC